MSLDEKQNPKDSSQKEYGEQLPPQLMDSIKCVSVTIGLSGEGRYLRTVWQEKVGEDHQAVMVPIDGLDLAWWLARFKLVDHQGEEIGRWLL